MIFLQTPVPPLPIETDVDRTPLLRTGGNVTLANARILTVTRGEIARGFVVIRNGRIAEVGAGDAPAGGTTIDLKGRILTPGLIDAHTHLASDAVNEGTDAVTPEVRILDVLNPGARGVYGKLAGGCTSSLSLHGSANPIGGESLIIKHKWRVKPEEMVFPGAPRVVKFALGENVKSGDRDPARYPATRQGVETVHRRAFTAARNYIAAKRAGRNPRKDLRLEALADMIEGRIIIHCHAYRQDEMLDLVRTCKEFGVKLVAFQHALEAYMIAPELAKAGVGASVFSDAWAFKFEGYDSIPYNAALLTRQGVLTSVNTDTGGGNTPFNLDAAKSMRYGGLTADECLRMVTINAAKHLLIDGKVGSIEVGKDADLAVWDGHPMSVYSRVNRTFVDGELAFERKDAFGLDAQASMRTEVDAPGGAILPLPKTARAYRITGATVHVRPGLVTNKDVLVVDGRIADGPAPSGTVTIPAKGLHLYPGLVDAGSDLGLIEFGQIDRVDDQNELGTIQPDLLAMKAVDPETARIPNGRLAGIATAVSHGRAGLVMGRSSILRMDGMTNEEIALVPEWGLHIRMPAGSGALSEFARANLSEADQNRVGDADRNRRSTLGEFLARAKRYALARRAGAVTEVDAKLEATIPYMLGERPVVFAADGKGAIEEAVRLAKELGLKAVIEGGKESWKVTELLKKEDVPVILLLPVWSQPDAAGQVAPLSQFDPYDAWWATPALLARAGVRFAFASDSSENTYNLPYRAGQACAWGLPREDALRALTIGAAEILGLGTELGTVEKGKRATLILTSGDPMELTTSVRLMMIDGKPVSLESKWTRLYDKYRVRR